MDFFQYQKEKKNPTFVFHKFGIPILNLFKKWHKL